MVCTQGAQTTDKSGQLGCGHVQHVGAVEQQHLRRCLLSGANEVAESVGPQFEHLERLRIGLLLRGIGATGRERHRDAVAGVLGSLLHSGGSGEHDQVGQRDLLAARAVEVLLDLLENGEHLCQLGRLVGLPVLLRLKANTRTVGSTAHVGAAEATGRRPCSVDQLGYRQTGLEHLALERSDVLVVNQFMVDCRNRVLPQLCLGDPGAQEAGDGPHVAMQELVPSLGKGFGELLGVVQPAAGDLAVDGVLAQRDVGDQHGGGPARSIERIWDGARSGTVFGDELPCAGGTLGQFPLEAVEVLQEPIAPLGGGRGPHDLKAAGDGVPGVALAVAVLPAQTLLLLRGAFGLGTDLVCVVGAVGLSEAVTTDDQRSGFLVVHGHAAERLADVLGCCDGVGLAFGPFGIDVDQAHGGGAELLVQLAFALVTLVGAQPLVLRTPEHLFGLPDVCSAEREAEGLETHRLQCAVACEHQEVGPRDLAAVLLLDRPQQSAGLVEVGVVGPAVERGETLCALTAATAAVEDTVGACRVPAHADEQAAVVAVVGRPPVLRRGHQVDHVGLECLHVELRELCRVVEVLAERVRLGGVCVQDRQVDLLRPPVLVGERGMPLRLRRRYRRVFALTGAIGSGV